MTKSTFSVRPLAVGVILLASTGLAQASVYLPITLDYWMLGGLPGSYPYNPVPDNGPSMALSSDGLTFYGSGYREASWILSTDHYDITSGPFEVKYKWKANGGAGWGYSSTNDYMGVGLGVAWDMGGPEPWRLEDNFTTDHSFAGSVVISPDTWYFTTIIVDTVAKDFVINTATGNYYGDGGVLFRSQVKDVAQYWQYLGNVQVSAALGDNYGAHNANVTLAEAIVSDSASSVPEPSSLLLLGSSLAAVVFARRRKFPMRS